MRIRYPLSTHLRGRRCVCLKLLVDAAPCVQWLTSRLGQFCIPPRLRGHWEDVTRRYYAAMAPELRSFWPTFPWANNEWVVNSLGQALSIDDFPRVAVRHMDEVDLTYCGAEIFRFHNPCSNAAHLEGIAHWVWTLIVNTDIHPEDTMTWQASTRVYSASPNNTSNRYEWTMQQPSIIVGLSLQQKWYPKAQHCPDDRIEAHVSRWGEPVVFTKATGSAQVMADFKHLRSMQHGASVLSAHPAIQHGPVLVALSNLVRRPLGRQELKRALQLPTEILRQLNRTAAELIICRLQHAMDKTTDIRSGRLCLRKFPTRSSSTSTLNPPSTCRDGC